MILKEKDKKDKKQVPVSNWVKNFLWLGQGSFYFAKAIVLIVFIAIIAYETIVNLISIETVLETVLEIITLIE